MATFPFINDGGDHLDLILATAEIGIWELDVTTGNALRNLKHDQIFGYDDLLDAWSAEIFLSHVTATDRERVGKLLTASVDDGQPWAFQTRITRADGADRWISAKGMPRTDNTGKVTKLIGHVIDITESKENEDRLKLLTTELNHRVANTFTILNSMVRHAAKKTNTVDEFADTLTLRLAALARSNRILTAQESERSNLQGILDMELGAFQGWQQRIHVDGNADIWFSGEASEALALIFHELLTNAVKYGALSVSSGHVTIAIQNSAGRKVEVDWTERGGPAVSDQRTPGIGSSVMAHAMKDEGTVDLNYAPEGLTCRIVLNDSFRREVPGEFNTKESPPAPTEVGSNKSLDGYRVLVVEDDPIIGLDLSDILKACGATVIGPYTTTAKALAAMRDKPQVALLDVNLGRETSAGVAARLTKENIPFLILSGQMDRSDLHSAFEGAPLVDKPFSDQDLIGRLIGVLS
ncbi:MAG: HWE histidine kinase domain-containing protein [Pseudomonadota bacterium]